MAATAHTSSLVAVEEFPTLASTGVAYLDSGATSQTPRVVLDAMANYYETARASVHRGVYPLAVEATELFEAARDRAAAWLGWDAPSTIFTRNATEAINLVAGTWGRANVGEGDRIVLTEMEHHSNLVPWWMLAQEKGAVLEVVPVDDNGELVLSRARRDLVARGREGRGGRARLQRARHGQPGGRHRPPRPRGRRGDGDRRLAGGAAGPRGPRGDRRRLLRLDRPQGLRADRRRRPARPPRAARGDAAVARRRAHDLERFLRGGPLRAAAGALRGRHVGDRRRHRPGRRGRVPLRPGHGHGPRARARAGRLRAGAPGRGAGARRSTARPTPTAAAR